MGARSRCAVACAAALAAMPSPTHAAPTYGSRLGSHSMLYLNHTAVQHEALFRAASEARLRYLRMDFAVGIVFARDRPDFSAVVRVNALAVKYRLRVVGTITDRPWHIAQHDRTWRDMVSEVVRHAPAVRRWELGNEPDNGFGFAGTPADYARWATLAAQGIRAAQPAATIAVGGFSRLDRSYIAAALHDPANPLVEQIDVANVHLRGPVNKMHAGVRRARAFYRRMGFSGPLWVTETGYPSLPGHQHDPPLTGGARDQATWITRAAKDMIHAGAGAVFVAFRDSPEFGADSGFASEGVVRWPQLTPDGRPYPKRAYWALRALAARKLTSEVRRRAGLG